MHRSRALGMALLVVVTAACGGKHDGNGDAGTGSDAPDLGDGGDDTCRAPQVLVLLDRTGTMHRDLAGNTPADTPEGHASSKFTIAIDAVRALVSTPQIDLTMQLGLAMFPLDPGGGECLTLSQRLEGEDFSNPACQAGEIVVPPALSTGATIAASIDPETTTICYSTPTGAGLQTAQDELVSLQQPNIAQYIMLVTDGADFYDSCPTPDPIPLLRQFDAAGIKTFIVGFGAQDTTTEGVNPPLLNQMACAGHTAKNFATACQPSAGGGYEAVDENGPALYVDAADGPALTTALQAVAQQVCCGCLF